MILAQLQFFSESEQRRLIFFCPRLPAGKGLCVQMLVLGIDNNLLSW
jgi:hypothetical protein